MDKQRLYLETYKMTVLLLESLVDYVIQRSRNTFVVNHTFKHSRTEYDNQLANCSISTDSSFTLLLLVLVSLSNSMVSLLLISILGCTSISTDSSFTLLLLVLVSFSNSMVSLSLISILGCTSISTDSSFRSK